MDFKDKETFLLPYFASALFTSIALFSAYSCFKALSGVSPHMRSGAGLFVFLTLLTGGPAIASWWNRTLTGKIEGRAETIGDDTGGSSWTITIEGRKYFVPSRKAWEKLRKNQVVKIKYDGF